VDLTPPAVSIDPGSGPNGTTSSTEAEFEFSTNDGDLECSLDAAAFAPCESPESLTGLADGPHTFTVRATDAAGNTGTASRSWTVDTTAPEATVNAGPANPTPSPDAEFEFSFDDPAATAECSIDGDDFEACTSPRSYAGLGEGEHTFTVRGTDAVGNLGPEEDYVWTIDSTASAVTIDSGPAALTNQTDASFAFTVDDPNADVDCSLDGGAFAPCDSATSQDYSGLAPGPHTFTVLATDQATNEASDSHSWTIDTTAPTASITDGPPALVSSDQAELSFTSDDPEASFRCRTDSDTGPFEPCASPIALDDLAEGDHSFEVRAEDDAGNLGPIATHSWTIDTVPPTVSITDNPPPATNAPTAEFDFSSSQPGSTFRCRIDSTDPDAYEPCGGPAVNGSKSYAGLDPGDHSFDVIAIDEAGNVADPDSHSWTIDATAPTVTITGNPPTESDQDSLEFTYVSSEPGSTFECRLDGGSFHSCPSPHLEENLPDGAHSFEVRAKDAVNNTGPVATHLWISDTEDPVVAFDSGPPNGSSINQTSVSFAFHADEEPEDPIECMLEGPGIPSPQFGPCDDPAPGQGQNEGTFTRSGLADGTYTLSLRAVDLVGRSSAPVSRTWTVDTAQPTVTIGSGPSGLFNSSSASFQFTTSEPGVLRCSLDGAPPASCGSPTSHTYTGLNPGPHSFTVTSTDAAGNVGSASRSWTVDTTAPETNLTSAPASGPAAAATFEFSSPDPGATFECALDGAIFTPCTSPVSFSGLGEGDHTFRVRAVDEAGNKDPQPAAHSWRVVPASTLPATVPPQGDTGGVAGKSKCKKRKRKGKRRKCKAKK
jgi:large repetitive protein